MKQNQGSCGGAFSPNYVPVVYIMYPKGTKVKQAPMSVMTFGAIQAGVMLSTHQFANGLYTYMYIKPASEPTYLNL